MKQKWNVRNVWGIISPLLWYLAIAYLIQFAAVFICSAVMAGEYTEQMMAYSKVELSNMLVELLQKDLLLMNALAGFMAIPIGMLLMYLDTLKEKQAGIFIKYKETNYAHYLIIIPLALSAMIMGNMLVSVIQAFMPKDMLATYDEAASIIYNNGIAIQILGTVIAAPIIEEIIFRGLIFKRISRISGSAVAIVVSALLFGLFHMNAVQAVYGFILGLILAYIYDKYKSIAAPILMHAIANLVSVLATFSVTEEELQKTQEIVYTPQDLVTLSNIAAVAGVITVLLLIVVHKIEKPVIVEE